MTPNVRLHPPPTSAARREPDSAAVGRWGARRGWASRSEGADEIFRRDFSLARRPDNVPTLSSACSGTTHPFDPLLDHVTSLLAHFLETKSFQSADRLGARNARKLRHAQEWRTSSPAGAPSRSWETLQDTVQSPPGGLRLLLRWSHLAWWCRFPGSRRCPPFAGWSQYRCQFHGISPCIRTRIVDCRRNQGPAPNDRAVRPGAAGGWSEPAQCWAVLAAALPVSFAPCPIAWASPLMRNCNNPQFVSADLVK